MALATRACGKAMDPAIFQFRAEDEQDRQCTCGGGNTTMHSVCVVVELQCTLTKTKSRTTMFL